MITPGFIFGLAIAIAGAAIMVFEAIPKAPDPPPRMTLAIYVDDKGNLAATDWYNGRPYDDYLQHLVHPGLRLLTTYEIDGRPAGAP